MKYITNAVTIKTTAIAASPRTIIRVFMRNDGESNPAPLGATRFRDEPDLAVVSLHSKISRVGGNTRFRAVLAKPISALHPRVATLRACTEHTACGA